MSKKLDEMLEESLRRYHNKAITSAKVIVKRAMGQYKYPPDM